MHREAPSAAEAQPTGDFEMLGAELHVDLSETEQSPNPLQLASKDELRAYWARLRSIISASLGTDTRPRR
jgi:hypothetical protein